MRDPITFARLISEITGLRGRSLNRTEIESVAETVNSLAAGMGGDIVDRLLAAMRNGQKINAIKEYRSLTGLGLKESKDAVELYWTYPSEHPAVAAAE